MSRLEAFKISIGAAGVGVSIVKLLLKSCYDIARKNIEDTVPKAIMHFLVNHTKRELHNICILKLFREDVFDDLLRESADITAKRKMIRETLRFLQEAYKGLKLLNILTKYCEAFTSMIEGKNEELLNGVLSGVAWIHYIFHSIFVKSLEEVDPCEDVSDEDIGMTIQNATGPKGVLLVPEAPFEVLVRGLVGRLLDPSFRCAKFIYDELIKMSNRSLANELHQCPFLRKCMEEVIGNFLRGLQQAETMITHLIETEMDYINISHPNFIGENKAVEIAQQQVKASRLAASVSRPKANHTKRELHNIFIEKLYRENLFDGLLREPDDIAARKRIKETLRVLQQAYKTFEELPLQADTVEMGYFLDSDSAGLPKVQSLSSSFNSASSDYNSPYTASPKIQGSRRRL